MPLYRPLEPGVRLMTAPDNTTNRPPADPSAPPQSSKRPWRRWVTGRKIESAADTSTGGRGENARQFESWVAKVSWILTGSFLLFSLVLGLSLGSGFADRMAIMLAGNIVALASTSLGCLVGFTFAIPRALQSTGAESDSRNPRYIANTNFEQISDWLTKILVGVSLVQIGNLRPALGALGNNLKPMLGGSEASAGFGVAMCVAATVAGFLLAYMWTRVILQWFLATTDRDIDDYEKATATKRLLDTTRASVAKSYDESIKEHLNDDEQIGAIIDSAQSEMAKNTVTVDLSPFDPLLGSIEVPISEDTRVQDLLNTVYAALPTSVPAFTYGKEWLLRRPDDHRVYQDMGRPWARSTGQNGDSRSLADVDIQRGNHLEVIPGPARASRGT